MSRVQINAYVCKLRLLQYGLVDEAGVIDSMGTGKADKKKSKDEGSDSEDEDEEDLIERRNTYVKKCIREAQASGRLKSLMAGAKNPIATEQRRTVVKEFFKDIVSFKKCANCSGYVGKFLISYNPEDSQLTLEKYVTRVPERPIFEDFPKVSAREGSTCDAASWFPGSQFADSSPAGQEP